MPLTCFPASLLSTSTPRLLWAADQRFLGQVSPLRTYLPQNLTNEHTPGLESSVSSGALLGHDLASMGHASDASLTPPSGSRSVTASPPRANMTAEQRELKRQRDQARRSSKEAARIRRSSSNPYVQGTPITMAEAVSAALTLPVYTTAPASISLLAEPVTTMASQTYVPSYSPPLPDHGQGNVYPNAYGQQLCVRAAPLEFYPLTVCRPPYSMPMDYPQAYPPAQYR
jgi:hypothetical protein